MSRSKGDTKKKNEEKLKAYFKAQAEKKVAENKKVEVKR